VIKDPGKTITKEEEELVAVTQITQSPLQQTPQISDAAQRGFIENAKNTVKGGLQAAAGGLL